MCDCLQVEIILAGVIFLHLSAYNSSLSLCKQVEVVVKVDSTKEVLKMRRLVLVVASEKYTAARAGMTGKEK